MFFKNVIKGLAITMASLGSVVVTTPHSLVKAQGVDFYCETAWYEGDEVLATRIDIPRRGDRAFILWTDNVFKGSYEYNWERCQSAAENLENNLRAGNLEYMFPASHPYKDRYNVICAARTGDELDWDTCPEERVLFEVHRREDPAELVIRIGETSTGIYRDDGGINPKPYRDYNNKFYIRNRHFSRHLSP